MKLTLDYQALFNLTTILGISGKSDSRYLDLLEMVDTFVRLTENNPHHEHLIKVFMNIAKLSARLGHVDTIKILADYLPSFEKSPEYLNNTPGIVIPPRKRKV